MSSFISSSDQRGAGFLAAFVVAALGLMALILVAIVILDPYGTGRLTPLAPRGVPETGPRMANANRLQNPTYDAAVVGNSTIQLLNPERLSTTSGRRFVQLSIPGTGPQEQTALVERLFAVRGPTMKALVVGIEEQWCNVAYETKTANPFPFWLYSLSDLAYVRGLFRFDTLDFVPRRIRLLLGRERPARPDGFWDYEQIGAYNRNVAEPPGAPHFASPVNGRNAATPFLRRLLDAAPAQTRVILIHPPIYVRTPPRETEGDRRNLARCKSEVAEVAAKRPGTVILDFWVDNALTRNADLFFDHNHYRAGMAKEIEAEIAKALRN